MTRPRLQLHLSTLLIVSLLAAGLVWLNVHLRNGKGLFVHEFTAAIVHSAERGWPLSFQSVPEPNYEYFAFASKAEWFDTRSLLINIAVCLFLLAVAAVAIEWSTRRIKRGAP